MGILKGRIGYEKFKFKDNETDIIKTINKIIKSEKN